MIVTQVDINAKDSFGRTALSVAVEQVSGCVALHCSDMRPQANDDFVSMLLDKGAEADLV